MDAPFSRLCDVGRLANQLRRATPRRAHCHATPCRVLYCCLALSCVFIGASSTHGLGGYLRHVAAGAARTAGAAIRRSSSGSTSAGGCRPPAGSEEAEMEAEGGGVSSSSSSGDRGWRFFQPFQGGSVFVATQVRRATRVYNNCSNVAQRLGRQWWPIAIAHARAAWRLDRQHTCAPHHSTAGCALPTRCSSLLEGTHAHTQSAFPLSRVF